MATTKQQALDWLVDRLSPRMREKIFRRLGVRLGVRSFTCSGSLGTFEGSINDETVHSFFLRHGTWARSLQSLLIDKIFFRGRGTFVDIGANIGLTLVPLARAREIRCIGFEPEPQNYTLLRKNIIANGVESCVETFNVALFSSDETVDLEMSDDNSGDHRIRLPVSGDGPGLYGEQSRTTQPVEARRLDGLLDASSCDKPIAVKMDVQGAELRVFQGGARFFAQADYLILEYWPYGLRRMGDPVEAFVELVQEFPYGALLRDTSPAAPPLTATEKLVEPMTKLAERHDNEHFDLVLARHSSYETQG